MIRRLHLQDIHQARQLLEVQRAAYLVEAELIGSFDIPPLHEDLESLQQSGETFYGYWVEEALSGAISYKRMHHILDIYRLVVHPAYFRRGIGKALVQFVERVEDGIEIITVSTGAKNVPAKRLYSQLGFVEKRDEEVLPGLLIRHFEKNINREGLQ